MKVTIIGGGVIGLCSAYYLLKQGCSVTIIDKGDITDGTSFGNAGYVSPSHFIPLASPGIIAKGLQWMLSSSSPFYIKPRLNADLIRWGLCFWKNANQKTVEKNGPALNNILHLSRRLTTEMKNEMGNHFYMEEKGCFMLYKNVKTEEHEKHLAEEAKQFGIETVIMNSEEVQKLEPEVEVNVRGGVLYPIDAHLHPGKFMKTLKDHLIKNGAQFILNTQVKGFEKSDNKISAVITNIAKIDCEELVIANGSWMLNTLKQLNIKIYMQAGKGYSMTFENISKNLHYPAILVDDRVAMTPMGPHLRMGGTMEISGLNSPVLMKRAEAIFNAAKNYYPHLPLQFPGKEKVWYGFRPLTPDGLPYIGRHSKYSNLTLAGGHAMLGLSLAAATGKLVEEIIGHKESSVNLSFYRPERFN